MVAISQEHSSPGLQPASLALTNWISASMRSALACRESLQLQCRRCHACHVGAFCNKFQTGRSGTAAMASKALLALEQACLVIWQAQHDKVSRAACS